MTDLVNKFNLGDVVRVVDNCDGDWTQDWQDESLQNLIVVKVEFPRWHRGYNREKITYGVIENNDDKGGCDEIPEENLTLVKSHLDPDITNLKGILTLASNEVENWPEWKRKAMRNVVEQTQKEAPK